MFYCRVLCQVSESKGAAFTIRLLVLAEKACCFNTAHEYCQYLVWFPYKIVSERCSIY